MLRRWLWNSQFRLVASFTHRCRAAANVSTIHVKYHLSHNRQHKINSQFLANLHRGTNESKKKNNRIVTTNNDLQCDFIFVDSVPSFARCRIITCSYRVVLFGDSGVGKTALVSQFMTSEYIHTYDASLGKQNKYYSCMRDCVSSSVCRSSYENFLLEHTFKSF